MIKFFIRTTGERDISNYNFLNAKVLIDKNNKPVESFISQLKQISRYDSILLEDDLEFCENFIEEVNKVIEQFPNKIINFFSLPFYHINTRESFDFYYNQCTFYPKGIASKIAKEMEKLNDGKTPYDVLENKALRVLDIQHIMYRPCLVQHMDKKSLISGEKFETRTTYYYIEYLKHLKITYEESNNDFYKSRLRVMKKRHLETGDYKKNMYKISIYAICKNEEKNVLPWLENVKYADYIVVLDTGSTDNTIELFEKAKETYPQLIFKTTTYEKFTFDKARNDNLEMVPEDTDIYMSTDLDERITDGWYEELQEKWTDETTRCEYFFVMEHLDNGENGKEYIKNKIHAKGWHWDLPVHEVLKQDGTNEEFPKETKFTRLNLKVHHWQDKGKDRSYYSDLIREMAKNPDTNLKKLYLAIVNFNEKQYDVAEEQLKEIIGKEDVNTVIKAYCYNLIAKIKINQKDINEGAKQFLLGIEMDKQFRENYIDYAQYVLRPKKQYEIAISYCKQAIKYGAKKNIFVERADMWSYIPYEQMMFCYFDLQDWKNALLCNQMVLKFMPNSDGMKNNTPKILKNLTDKDFID